MHFDLLALMLSSACLKPLRREILPLHGRLRHGDTHTQHRERQQQLRLVEAIRQDIECARGRDAAREE